MNRFFSTSICMRLILFLAVLINSLQGISQTNERRLALVIGNAAYQYGGQLKNPVSDANLMGSTLQELGFDVIKKTDARLSDMQNTFKEFVSRLDNYDVALFFYAVHGLQVDG